jgi:hypothetical protein
VINSNQKSAPTTRPPVRNAHNIPAQLHSTSQRKDVRLHTIGQYTQFMFVHLHVADRCMQGRLYRVSHKCSAIGLIFCLVMKLFFMEMVR